ncbi:2-succinyl-5-enolpyruvyl-6-hydroxy-3-cyclohexene-1-carboxylate synthase [Ureibacillus acetophenoni]
MLSSSPGSKINTFSYALASAKDIQVYRQVDERSAAFFALGLAKAKQKPVALLCTSGTAAANYYPAIIEAKYSRIPLIVLQRTDLMNFVKSVHHKRLTKFDYMGNM